MTVADITIRQAATYSRAITVADTTGKTYKAAIRGRFNVDRLATFTCTISGATTVVISLTATQTNGIEFPHAIRHTSATGWLGYWDLEEIDGETITIIENGKVNIARGATRSLDDG